MVITLKVLPTDSVLTTMALTASDFFLVPMRPERFSILGFGNLLSSVKSNRDCGNLASSGAATARCETSSR